MSVLTCLEICAGAGGQALGLAIAGFHHLACIEIEKDYCDKLSENRPEWNVICQDIHSFDGKPYYGKVDLLAGGVPCPPFSVAGQQLGEKDERDLFPEALRLVKEINPKAVMIENVKGFLSPKFLEYRTRILNELDKLGYDCNINLINASDYGVPQLRPRAIIVGIRKDQPGKFEFPEKQPCTNTVGDVLFDLMKANGWKGASYWRKEANGIAPTLVGGSKKHGGPDLGPTRAREAWSKLGIDGSGVSYDAPDVEFVGKPKLTPRMMARLQGFPDTWTFGNTKTKACRMIGNAFPPPVARAIGENIKRVLLEGDNYE